MRGRELVFEHFLNQHDVDICLLSEIFLKRDQAYRFANYVCHRTDTLTAGGGSLFLVRSSIVQHSVTVSGLTHVEATAIQIAMSGKHLKNLAAYISPHR